MKQVAALTSIVALGTIGLGAWQARDVLTLLAEVKDPNLLQKVIAAGPPLPAGFDPSSPKTVKVDFLAPYGPLLQGRPFHGQVNCQFTWVAVDSRSWQLHAHKSTLPGENGSWRVTGGWQ